VSVPVVAVRDLVKVYDLEGEKVVGVNGVDVTIEPGEFVAVMGPSGSGKSTFMHLVGLLDSPTSGQYFFEGHDVSQLSGDERADIRNHRLGFVFQSYNLLPRTSAIENIELPLVYGGVPEAKRRPIAMEKLEMVGLTNLQRNNPNQMSGGQQQRIAIARALVNNPGLILADEPTGALDTKTSEDVMQLFEELNATRGITIMLVTHEPEIANHAKRIIAFRDGKVLSDAPNPHHRSQDQQGTEQIAI
jgi:putative ABC transport system ATP-binding protein